LIKRQNKDPMIQQKILKLVKEENPERVEQLVKLTKERLTLTEKEALKYVLQLTNQEKIQLKESLKHPTAQTLNSYIRSSKAYWFWTTISLATVTATTVFTIPEDAYPMVYIRYVLGSIFVLCCPATRS